MKLEHSHIEQIRAAFEKMQSRKDLLNILNEAKPLVYGDNAVPFELKQLTWYANPNLGRKRYTEFKIKKKSGAERCIHAPVKGLKSLQKTLSFVLQCVYEPHIAAMGFVKNRSIVDNARLHEGSKYVYNIDLRDFFPSIDQARVWKCLQLNPFNLSNDKNVVNALENGLKISDFSSQNLKKVKLISKNSYPEFVTAYLNKLGHEGKDSHGLTADNFEKLFLLHNNGHWAKLPLANIIASLCCTEMEVERKSENGEWEKVKRNVLPQGAPTSPVITNIVCQKLDYLLSGVAKRFGLKYSRYADDITFSSMHNVYQQESEFLKELHRIIAAQNFHIKDTKTRLQKNGYRKEVTGLLVNEKVNVQQRYIKQLRMWLYYWERYGYERASGFFLHQYIADKGHVKNGKPDMANVISGKLDYLKMVKGETNSLYKKLVHRFNILSFEKPILFSKEKNEIKTFKYVILEKEKEYKKKIVNREKEIKEEFAIKAKDETLYIIHDPKKTVWLLNKFTEDTYLKSTTHIWDRDKETSRENINRNSFNDEIKKEFYSKYYFQILLEIGLSHLYWTIADFIVGPNHFGWGNYKLQFGWYDEQLKNYYLENRDKQPGSFLVPEEFIPNKKIDGRYLKYFDDFIDCFKNEIQFRGNSLYITIKTEFEKQLGFEYKVDYEGLKGIDIYTDTKQISEAFQIIASNIRQHPDKNKILKVRGIHRKAEKLYEIRIEDIGSFANAPIESDKLMLKDKKGQIYKIRDLLISLCDFSIESKFRVDGDTFKGYELSYLSEDRKKNAVDMPYVKKEVENPNGFTYILKFYE